MKESSRPRAPEDIAARRNFVILCTIATLFVIALVIVTALVTA
jgi:hypothetical protein